MQMLFSLPIPFIIFSTIFLQKTHADPRICGGLRYDTIAQPDYQCIDDGTRRGKRVYKCQRDAKYGCERFQMNGQDEWWCCGVFCDSAATFPLDLSASGTRICQVSLSGTASPTLCADPTNSECKLIESSNQYYCCPRDIMSATSMNPLQPNRPSGSCDDFRSDCQEKADWCILEMAYERMFRDCPKTCNRCEGQCRDLGTDCPDRKRDGYCERAVYRDLMDWQCPQSCDRCEIRGQRMPRGQIPLTRG